MRGHGPPLGGNAVIVEVQEISVSVDGISLLVGAGDKLVLDAAPLAFAGNKLYVWVTFFGLDLGIEHVPIGAVAGQVLGVVKDEAGVLALVHAQAAPNNLLEQAHAFGRTQDGDHVNVGRVEPSGQDRDVDQILDLLGLEVCDDFLALRLGRVSGDQRRQFGWQGCHALFGVFDRGGKDHHATQVGGLIHDVGHDGGGLAAMPVERAVDVGGVKLPTAVQFHAKRLVSNGPSLPDGGLGQEALFDQFVGLDAVDAGFEIGVFGLVFADGLSIGPILEDVARVHPIRRGGHPHHAQHGIHLPDFRDDVFDRVGQAVTFIANNRRELAAKLLDGIDHGARCPEHHRVAQAFLSGAGRKDGTLRACQAELVSVLVDQFGAGGEAQDVLALGNAVDGVGQCRDDVGLARPRGRFNAARGGVSLDPTNDLVVGFLLVGAQCHGYLRGWCRDYCHF